MLTVDLAFVVQLSPRVAVGSSWALAARVSIASVVQAVVTLAIYRWRIGDDNLAPHRPRDIVALALASLVGAVVVIPLGPAPGVWLTSSAFDLFWWTALSTAYVFVGSACIMLLVQRRPRAEAIPTRLLDVYVQLLVTAVCLGVVFAFDELPLTWIVLLPAIWAGLTLGPWTSAAYSLTGTLAVVIAQAIPATNGVYGTLRRCLHPAARQPDDRVRVRGAAALAGARPAGPPRRRGGRASPGGDRPGGAARHGLRVDQRGAGADGHRR